MATRVTMVTCARLRGFLFGVGLARVGFGPEFFRTVLSNFNLTIISQLTVWDWELKGRRFMSAYRVLGAPTFNYVTDLFVYYPAWYFYLINVAGTNNRSLVRCIKESFEILPNLANAHKFEDINVFEIKTCVHKNYLRKDSIEINQVTTE